jgi:hypothetical protein
MAELKLGKPDTKPDTPTHVKGTAQGNSTGNYESQEGHLPDGRSTAQRSTGICPSDRNPILTAMPNLSPP